MVWQQVKVAATNKTNNKSSKRGPRGLWHTLGRGLWGRFGPKRPPSGAQGPPRRSLAGCNRATNKNSVLQRFVVQKQVKVAPSNKTNKKSNNKALKCSWPFGAPQQEPQVTPKGGPMASLEEPLWAKTTL